MTARNHLDAVARRGAPYPYPRPLPEDVRHAHATMVRRAAIWGLTCMVAGLPVAVGIELVYFLVDDLASRYPDWAVSGVAGAVLVLGGVLAIPHLWRAQRHGAVLAAYPRQEPLTE